MNSKKPTLAKRASLATLALLLLLAACQQATRPPSASTAPPAASAAWDAYVSEFLESYFVAHPDVAVWAGRHEFDGQLPDWSTPGVRKRSSALHSARQRASEFKDDSLDDRQRFERDYLMAMIDGDLFWSDSVGEPFRNPSFYGWAMDPNVYIAREYAPLAARMRAYIKYAKSVPAAAEQIRNNLRTPMPKTYVQIGHITFGGLASFYEKDVPTVFASVTDPQLRADFRAANAGAIKAMKDLDAWFTQQEASANDDFALGPEKFGEMLRATERVDTPLVRLREMAERDLDRNLAALREACGAFAPMQRVEACVVTMQANKPQGTRRSKPHAANLPG